MPGTYDYDTEDKFEILRIKTKKPATAAMLREQDLLGYLLEQFQGKTPFKPGDILVITSKLVSIFEGRTVEMKYIKPSKRSKLLGKIFGKDPCKVQMVQEEGSVGVVVPFRKLARIPAMWERLMELSANREGTAEIIAQNKSIFMVKKHGTQLDDAGIDFSNAPLGWVSLLPEDPCVSAKTIREEIEERFDLDIPVIITDTSSVLGKIGALDVALGYSGIDPINRKHGHKDLFGNPKSGGLDLIIDAIAATAGLAMGQTDEATPACIVRGYAYVPAKEECRMDLLSYPRGLMFRGIIWAALSTFVFHVLNLILYPWRNSRQEN